MHLYNDGDVESKQAIKKEIRKKWRKFVEKNVRKCNWKILGLIGCSLDEAHHS